ncbi:hypothetical protein NA56DRAFT_385394 [Hyaloscypha hepaticicola]|uniref:Uncharacterized protein n=1 Tax=Hyaloscypha hepaticicola TaxID=2082293 RepID=A0A2J6QHM6_9HELO|nr:hypothetical protein NA56DRAFT_385394 [Hyaloscypha hepaticicola]
MGRIAWCSGFGFGFGLGIMIGWMGRTVLEIPIVIFGIVLALARMLLCFARDRIIDELVQCAFLGPSCEE